MKPAIIWLFALVCIGHVHGQDTPRRSIVMGTLSFAGLGVSGEWNAHKYFTVETSVAFGPSYVVEDDAFFNTALAYPVYDRPAIRFSVTPRIYLMSPRPVQTRKVDPYLGFQFSYVTKPLAEYGGSHDAWLFHLHIGLRQMVSKKFVFNGYVGIGRAQNAVTGEGSMFPAFNALIGYVFN